MKIVQLTCPVYYCGAGWCVGYLRKNCGVARNVELKLPRGRIFNNSDWEAELLLLRTLTDSEETCLFFSRTMNDIAFLTVAHAFSDGCTHFTVRLASIQTVLNHWNDMIFCSVYFSTTHCSYCQCVYICLSVSLWRKIWGAPVHLYTLTASYCNPLGELRW